MSNNQPLTIMDKYDISLDCRYSLLLNPDDDGEYSPVTEIPATISLFNNETEEYSTAGYLELHYYNVGYAINHHFNIFNTFDRSMNTYEMGATIIDQRTGYVKDEIVNQLGEDNFNFNILVIQRMGIYPQFRGQGIGKIVLKGLTEKFTDQCGYIFLKCFPHQCEAAAKSDPSLLVDEMQLIKFDQNYKTAQQKLNRYYKECGFTKLKGTDNYFGYLMG